MLSSDPIDTVHMQFGACQKMEKLGYWSVGNFITVTKHSHLFLLDRHQTACALSTETDEPRSDKLRKTQRSHTVNQGN